MHRYQSRGLFLDPPTVGLDDGVWSVTLPPLLLAAAGEQVQLQLTWPSQDAIFDLGRDGSPLVQLYRRHVEAALDRHASHILRADASCIHLLGAHCMHSMDMLALLQIHMLLTWAFMLGILHQMPGWCADLQAHQGRSRSGAACTLGRLPDRACHPGVPSDGLRAPQRS